jgi:ankyrin repeat protein
LGECREYAALDTARADVSGQDGLTGKLHSKSSKDKADTVYLLIRQGADVTARDDTHSTPLHLASSKSSAETVDLLIHYGSDVNAKDANQSTPLHLAASSHLALKGTIVRLLLRHGANVDAKDSEGRTPLDIASSEGFSWIAKLLLDHHARG